MDDKVIRSALLKQLIGDIGKNRVKGYKSGPKEEDLKEMDPSDVKGSGFEMKKIEIMPEIDDEDDDAIPPDIQLMIDERRRERREKANKRIE